MNFGDLEGRLASAFDIRGSMRTKFQARLRNYLRLGFPSVKKAKGKATQFSPDDLLMLAAAVELTDLGLSPELIIEVLKDFQGEVISKEKIDIFPNALRSLKASTDRRGSSITLNIADLRQRLAV